MKIKFIIVLFLSSFYLSAQKNIDVSSGDVNAMSPSFFTIVSGEPLVSAKFSKLVDGSPYFTNEWMKGNVILDGDKQYTSIYIKLDLFDNEVHYRNQAGIELIATNPIRKIILFDTVTQKVLTFVNIPASAPKSREANWYQLLVESKASLLKKFDKQLRETTPYGSATVEQTIYTSFRYFVLYQDSLKAIRKIKDLPGVLGDKKEELVQYIKTGGLLGKSDEDFESVLNYFNVLIGASALESINN